MYEEEIVNLSVYVSRLMLLSVEDLSNSEVVKSDINCLFGQLLSHRIIGYSEATIRSRRSLIHISISSTCMSLEKNMFIIHMVICIQVHDFVKRIKDVILIRNMSSGLSALVGSLFAHR